MIITPERFVKWTKNGEPTDRLAEYIEALTRQVNLSTILTGTGAPEGVIVANPTQLYMDDAGTSGNILYIKQSGVGNTGWILV